MAWVDKRELVPGGCDRLLHEIALSPMQVSFAINPGASTRVLVRDIAAAKRRPESKNSLRSR